jgi:hypothetical protein
MTQLRPSRKASAHRYDFLLPTPAARKWKHIGVKRRAGVAVPVLFSFQAERGYWRSDGFEVAGGLVQVVRIELFSGPSLNDGECHLTTREAGVRRRYMLEEKIAVRRAIL